MRFDRKAVAREARSWAIPAIVALPAGLVIYIGVTRAVPPDWARAIWFVLFLLPQVAIQLVDGWSLFAIAIWVVPATAIALVAFAIGATVGWIVLLVAGVTGWLLCMYESVRDVYGQPVRWLADWLVLLTMPSRQRAAYRSFLHAHPRHSQIRRAFRLSDGPASFAPALRATASEVLRLEAPDARWAEVFRASAPVYLQYAEMLEGTRALDPAAVKAIADSRDELLIALLRERSRMYRIVNHAPLRREHVLPQ
jgi:hypothetical protein